MDSDRPFQSGGRYARLFLRFFLISMACACIPLSFIGLQIHDSYFNYSSEKMKVTLQKRMEANRDIIDDYFKERLNDLNVIMDLHSIDYLKNVSNLRKIFLISNQSVQNYEDLGIINDKGFHESYVGPYDLMANDYSQTFWFRELTKNESFISDLFLGYRNIPHIIIAVTRIENGKKWILRATVNADLLNSKLKRLIIGEAGNAFLLNSLGYYQSAPETEDTMMDKSPYDTALFDSDSGVLIIDDKKGGVNSSKIAAYARLTNPAWILVMVQDYEEFFSDRTYADRATWTFLSVSALSILVFVAASMAYIVAEIKKRDQKLSKLNVQLVQTGKMAAIGQLAAGVAHEINNPIAVIQSQIDLVRQVRLLGQSGAIDLDGALEQIESQVERCSRITAKLLGFSRRDASDGRLVDLNDNIREVAGLFERWVATGGIDIELELAEDLPKVAADSFEVDQVLINLVGNAVDACDEKEGGVIHIRTRTGPGARYIYVTVKDSGSGISPEHLKSIFDPFFTTKPVGKGTGLGLSISCSIMKNLGGEITVHSEWKKGAEFTLVFPVPETGSSRAPTANERGAV
ncbi:MAG: ATP-binding protein [Syntrophobacter sp.]